MNDLKICFTESLFIEDFGIPSIDLNPSPRSNVVREYESKDLNKRKPGHSVSETFGNYIEYPALGEHESSVDGLLGGENWHEDHKASKINYSPKSVDKCFSRRMSLHIPLKLVSAVRGGREKQGCVPKKLSVTWASDVHDPIPAVESHVPSSKNRHNRNSGKKYGRNPKTRSRQGSMKEGRLSTRHRIIKS